jgi:hypothetical protein
VPDSGRFAVRIVILQMAILKNRRRCRLQADAADSS